MGHAHSAPVRWGAAVDVFGTRVEPGQLIHADKHGFIVIPKADEAELLEAARFMDTNECETVIAAARSAAGQSMAETLSKIDAAAAKFASATKTRFS